MQNTAFRRFTCWLMAVIMVIGLDMPQLAYAAEALEAQDDVAIEQVDPIEDSGEQAEAVSDGASEGVDDEEATVQPEIVTDEVSEGGSADNDAAQYDDDPLMIAQAYTGGGSGTAAAEAATMDDPEDDGPESEPDVMWAQADDDFVSFENDIADSTRGTAEKPYRIKTEADLVMFQQEINGDTHSTYGSTDNAKYAGKHFVLLADIALTSSWVPVGKSTTFFFGGTFDGNGHTITNVTYAASGTSAAHVGFIGYARTPVTGDNVVIRNLRITGQGGQSADLVGNTSTSSTVGGIVGYANPNTTGGGKIAVENCVTDINVSGARNVGGIVGQATTNVSITNCLALGNVQMIDGTGSYYGSYGGGILGYYSTSSSNPVFSGNLFLGQVTPTDNYASLTDAFANSVNALIGKVYGTGTSNITNNHYVSQENKDVRAWRTGQSAADEAIEPTEGMVVAIPTTAAERTALLQTMGWTTADTALVAANVPGGSGSDDPTPDPTTYTVTFDSDGGSAVSEQTVTEGEKATRPADPTKDGYTFAGWQLNDADYDFDTPVIAAITLKAAWTEVVPPAESTFLSDYADPERGTADNPYRISNEQDLYEFAKAVNGQEPVEGAWVATGKSADSFAGKFVSLECDIAITQAATPVGIGSNTDAIAGSKPISFSGTFLGGGHTVSNYFASAASNPSYGNTNVSKHAAGAYSGLFGSIAGATIQDVVVNLKVDMGVSDYSGGLVGGVAAGDSVIVHCAVKGDLTGNAYIGGLVGAYAGTSLTISRCYHQGKVTGTSSGIGGLVGYVGKGGIQISSSYQSGEVSSTGASTTLDQAKCYGVFLGITSSTYAATLTNCVTDQSAQPYPAAATKVTATGTLSGVTDWASSDVQSALGDVFDYSGGASVAPPFGAGYITPQSHAATFAVSEADSSLVSGSLPATISRKYPGDAVVVPKPATVPWKKGYGFAGWKAEYDGSADETLYNADDVFAMPATDVVFVAQFQELDPITIDSKEEFLAFAAAASNGTAFKGSKLTAYDTYKLTTDVTLTAEDNFVPIGKNSSTAFSGTFDGDGHVIALASSNSDYYGQAGLFGYANGAVIKNVGVEGTALFRDGNYCGGLVGYSAGNAGTAPSVNSTTGVTTLKASNYTVIDNCYSRAAVAGEQYVGGLIGYDAGFTRVTNSYATGSVLLVGTGASCRAGGLVGSLTFGTVEKNADSEAVLFQNVYASGEVVTGEGAKSTNLGSLVGYLDAAGDTVLASDSAVWPRLDNVFVLASGDAHNADLPAYTIKGAACADSVTSAVSLPEADLVAGAAKLGSAYKADATSPALRVNGGFPVLDWERYATAGSLRVYYTPEGATVTVVDDVLGTQLQPSNSTTVNDGLGSPVTWANVYTTSREHGHTVTVEADGYVTQTKQVEASESPVDATINLEPATYAITFTPGGSATWAQGYTAPSSYTVQSDEVALPAADDLVWDGYDFLGWYETEDFSGSPVTSIAAGSTGDKQFYGNWKLHEDEPEPADPVDRTALDKAIAQAKAAEKGVKTSADGSDVDLADTWVTPAAKTALDKAISAGENLGDDATQTQVDVATAAINTALKAFKPAAGTKKAAEPAQPSQPAQPSEPAAQPIVPASEPERLWGQIGLDTMTSIVDEGGFERGGTVVLATMGGYWDALTAAGIAGLADAPILMTDGTQLSEQTAAELAKLAPKTVIVCGGPVAVADSVASAAARAAANGTRVQRVWGQNAPGTAIDIYQKAPEITGGTWQDTAFVCTASGYYDAMSAAPVSYALHIPIFLSNDADSISDDTLKAMKEGGIKKVYICGGEVAITPAVAKRITDSGIAIAGRLWGATAIETSTAIAQFGLSQGMDASHMAAATVNGFVDGLCGAPLPGRNNSVMVLVNDENSSSIKEFVEKQHGSIEHLYVFGGPVAISDATYEALDKALE